MHTPDPDTPPPAHVSALACTLPAPAPAPRPPLAVGSTLPSGLPPIRTCFSPDITCLVLHLVLHLVCTRFTPSRSEITSLIAVSNIIIYTLLSVNVVILLFIAYTVNRNVNLVFPTCQVFTPGSHLIFT
jgi:hypothetical protein